MIKLDLYRFLYERHDSGFIEEPDVDCRYTAYKIFILETRLFPFIYNLLKNTDINIYPKSLYNPKTNRMDIYLKIAKTQQNVKNFEEEDEEITLTEREKEIIEKQLNKITSEHIDYALIDVKELYTLSGKRYPFTWFQAVFEYTLNDSSYNPFTKIEGIYLKFNPFSDYKPVFHKICQDILKKIDLFYEKGVIVLENTLDDVYKKRIIENWDLVSIEEEKENINIEENFYVKEIASKEKEEGVIEYTLEGKIEKRLFQPKWIDKRFAPNLVNFMLERVQDERYISFQLPNHLTKRHGIMKSLQSNLENEKTEIFIESSHLKVECDNLEKARKISSLIDYGFATTYGRVMILIASRISEVYLYSEYCQKNNIGDFIVYINDRQLFCSILLQKEYENSDTNILSKKLRDYTVSRLIEVSKVSKFKNLSPHQIIEEEYSK